MREYAREILKIINLSNEHLNAEQIFFKMKKIKPKIVLASVYNNLIALCDKELIKRITIEGQPDCFDKAIKHDHLVCKRCGKLFDVNFEDLTETLTFQLGIPILSYDLRVTYICNECKKEELHIEKNQNKK